MPRSDDPEHDATAWTSPPRPRFSDLPDVPATTDPADTSDPGGSGPDPSRRDGATPETTPETPTPDTQTPGPVPPRHDAPAGIDPALYATAQVELEDALVGRPRYTLDEVAELSGLDADRVDRLWRAFGFASGPDFRFTDTDVQLFRDFAAVIATGMVGPEMEVPVARALAQSLSKLANWQVGIFNIQLLRLLEEAFRDEEEGRPGSAVTPPESSADALRSAVDELVMSILPITERVQNGVWRRHLVAATGRRTMRAVDDERDPVVVGFADLVGYTRLTRRLDADELDILLERFEAASTDVVRAHDGWVVKTVGDEVMFAAEDPVQGARIGLELRRVFTGMDNVPDVRVGMAWGAALARFGDLFGSVVNMAARLTTAARPDTVLVSSDLADEISENPEFHLRPVRSVRIKDFSRIRAWALTET